MSLFRRVGLVAAALVFHLLGLCGGQAVFAQPFEFSTHEEFLGGEQVRGVRAGDMNGDGWVDVVVALGSELAWLEGDGQGGLGARQPLALLPETIYLDVVDRDGDLDLDVIAVTGTEAWFIENDLPAGFNPPVAFASGDASFPRGLALGDVTGNGLPDVVVARTGGVFLVPNFGTQWGLVETLATVDFPFGVVTGNLGGSSQEEIVVTTGTGTVVFTDGDVTLGTSYPNSGRWGPVLADFNLDGAMDLAAAMIGGGGASVLWGDGAGGFGASLLLQPSSNGFFALAAQTDVDGVPDVVLPPYSASGDLWVHRFDAGGSTGESFGHAVPSANRVGDAADLDGDGLDEILLATAAGLAILRPRSTGEYRASRSFEGSDSGVAVLLQDVTGDGIDDLVSVHSGAALPTVDLHRGLGAGEFDTVEVFPAGFNTPTDVAAGDLNSDGLTDLVVGRQGPNLLYLYQQATGGFGPEVFLPLPCSSPQWVEVAEVTGDSMPDVLTACVDSGVVLMLPGSGGNPVTVASGILPASLATADLDNDGLGDVVIGDRSTSEVVLLRSLGLGQFAAWPSVTSTSGLIRDVTVADLNDDGQLDLLVIAGASTLEWYPGNGLGGFGAAQVVPSAQALFLRRCVAGDLDGDGLPEVAAHGLQASGGASVLLAIWQALSPGTFAAPVEVPARSVADLDLSDVDGDGVLDLLTVDSGAIVVLRNETLDPLRDRRGDCDDDALFSVGDVVRMLEVAFQGGTASCPDACDVDDSGTISIPDPILLLQYLFQSGPAPAGVTGCRPDLTQDSLGPCQGSTACPGV